MYEAVEKIDPRQPPGAPIETRVVAVSEDEQEAIELARAARAAFLAEGREDYAWWLVREEGQQLARWIADSLSGKEMVLDLRSGELVELT